MNPAITSIRNRIAQAGLTIDGIAQRAGISDQAVRDAMRIPHKLGEEAIAKALGKPPSELWPDRYDAEGNRLKPQPKRLYLTGEAARHRLMRGAR